MVDRGLYLHVHCLFHLPLGISSVAAKGDKEHHCEDEEDADHMVDSVSIVEIDNARFHIVAHIICLEHCPAFLRSIGKPCANGVEDCLGL